jgi:hypothetical protein
MQVENYLIDHQTFEWSVILAEWSWLLPQDEFTIWLMNCYGDLILVFEDGTVNMLDIGNGSLEKISETKEEFCAGVDDRDNANNWFLISLVDRLMKTGKILENGCCYSFIVPPILGGEYTVENTATLNFGEHYGVYASIHKQVKDLPGGTQVGLLVK